MERKTFKQKWNEVDKVCPSCNQVTKVNRGLTKQNLGKLFQKPTIQDWIILIILFLAIFGTWVYVDQIKNYSEIWENPEEFCQDYTNIIITPYSDNSNVSNIILIENDEVK